MPVAARSPLRVGLAPALSVVRCEQKSLLPHRSLLESTIPLSAQVNRCWTLTEGAAGMVSQVNGLAEAVGLPFEHRAAVLQWPWKHLAIALIPRKLNLYQNSLFQADAEAPRLVISCGRQSVPASIALKRQLREKVYTVHIQDPKVSTCQFDMVIAPDHDGLRGPNVVTTLGALHHITPEKLAAAVADGPTLEMRKLSGPFVGVILGGPNKYYAYSNSDITRFIHKLTALVQKQGVSLAIVPSRRTPAQVLSRLRAEFGSEHFVWSGVGANPYLPVLALAQALIVTGDSVSMISEAAATEKPLYVEYLTERRFARRFRHFHQSYEQAGITRPFGEEFGTRSYLSPNTTPQIATMIRQKVQDLGRGSAW